MSAKTDEQWISDLRARVAPTLPVLEVDAADAVRLGRRARTRRWASAGTAAAGLVAIALVGPAVFAGVGGAAPADEMVEEVTVPGDAEIATTGPDCFADEVLQALLPQESAEALGLLDVLAAEPSGPAPASGRVPVDFHPVAVVECRIRHGLSNADPATYEIATLTGDVERFTETLRLPSLSRGEVPLSEGGCTAALLGYPSIYLVDETGRAVRPDWPKDGCNVAWPEVTDAFAALSVADVIQYRGTKMSYTAQDLAHAAELLTRALVAEGIADARVAATPALDAVEVSSAGLDTDPARQALVLAIAQRSIGAVPLVFAPCSSPCS